MRDAPAIEIAQMLQSGRRQRAGLRPGGDERGRRGTCRACGCAKTPTRRPAGPTRWSSVTEWNEFKQLDLARLKQAMRQPIIVDGRNIYDPR